MSLQKQFIKSKKAYKVTFCLPEEAAKGAEEVVILGDFNQWNKENGLAMKVKDGEYLASIELEPDKEYEFRYLIDNKVWENDWQADKYVLSPFGVTNSVVVTMPDQKEILN